MNENTKTQQRFDLSNKSEETGMTEKIKNHGDEGTMKKCSSCEKIFEIEFICCRECFSQKQSTSQMSEKPSNSSNKSACCCCGCHEETHPKELTANAEVSCDNISQVTSMSITSGCMVSSADKICRICLDSVNESDLIAPCKCSGSTKYAHESCLLEWFSKSSKKSCELCLSSVNVTPIGYKPVQQWRLPDQGCDFIVYLFGLYFLIMLIFTGMITWIATQGCLSPVCITLYIVCAIALIYFFYCCGCVEYSRRYWKALLSVNRVWRIYGRDDSLKNLRFSITPKQKKRDIVGIGTHKDFDTESIKNLKPFVIEVNECLSSPNNNNNRNDNDRSSSLMDKRHDTTRHDTTSGIDNHAIEYDDVRNRVGIPVITNEE